MSEKCHTRTLRTFRQRLQITLDAPRAGNTVVCYSYTESTSGEFRFKEILHVCGVLPNSPSALSIVGAS
jgi:hypothetical protein